MRHPARLLVAVMLTAVAGCRVAPVTAPAYAGISRCVVADLPSEAVATVGLIHSGGPFPYPRHDGVVFQNREGILPPQSRGYYHEYTVGTPGGRTRGTRRIITGGRPLTDPPHVYYTGDHYESFCEVHDK